MSVKKHSKSRHLAVAVVFAAMVTATVPAWAQSSNSGSSSSGSDENVYSAIDTLNSNSRLEMISNTTGLMENLAGTGNAIAENETQRSIVTAENILKDRLSTIGQDSTTTSTGTGSGMNLDFSSSGTNNQGSASQIDQTTSMYAPKLVVSFSLPTSRERAVQMAKNLSMRMKTTPNLSRLNEVEIIMKGGEATLHGRVTTPRDRTLVERIIMFEPGVRSVKNELVVDVKLAAQDPLWAGVNGNFDQLPSIEAIRESRLARQTRLVVEQKKSFERGTPKIVTPSAPL